MNIRDLTKRQLYNLRRRCEKEKKQTIKRYGLTSPIDFSWDRAYSLGVRAALDLLTPR